MNALLPDVPGVIAVFPDARARVRYPWKKLKVNECFVTHIDNRNRVDVQANYWMARTDLRFTSVRLPDDPQMFAVYRTQ